ncbi:MAG: biosynthetic-type acetolactate synthase large subunit, partial [Clostridia bacterium]
MQYSGARILIEELIAHGVDTVFGYPGAAVLDIYDELYRNASKIHHVISAHEQGAAHAADGYARSSGRTGVVIATSGPGATNLVTGIANAYLDSIPLVAITGNVAVELLGRDSFQEVDIIGITQPIVKHSFIVREIEMLAPTIRKAFEIAGSGRRGPVLIDISQSVQCAVHEYTESTVAVAAVRHVPCDLEQAVKAIAACQRPFIYCGGGVIASDAGDAVRALSEKISAPVGMSMMGLGAVPSSYPLAIGMCGMHGVYAASMVSAEADLIIAVGVRFSDRATGNVAAYSEGRTIIHIDIDKSEIGKNVRAQIGLCGDARCILNELYRACAPRDLPKWRAIGEKRDEEPKNNDFSPKNIIELVQAACDDETRVATDVGQHQVWTMQYYKFNKPRVLITSGGLGTMGFGLPAAIGASIAMGRSKCVLFTSDGSFGMNLTELATAVSQRIPLLIIILNNGV